MQWWHSRFKPQHTQSASERFYSHGTPHLPTSKLHPSHIKLLRLHGCWVDPVASWTSLAKEMSPGEGGGRVLHQSMRQETRSRHCISLTSREGRMPWHDSYHGAQQASFLLQSLKLSLLSVAYDNTFGVICSIKEITGELEGRVYTQTMYMSRKKTE